MDAESEEDEDDVEDDADADEDDEDEDDEGSDAMETGEEKKETPGKKHMPVTAVGKVREKLPERPAKRARVEGDNAERRKEHKAQQTKERAEHKERAAELEGNAQDTYDFGADFWST